MPITALVYPGLRSPATVSDSPGLSGQITTRWYYHIPSDLVVNESPHMVRATQPLISR